MIGQNQINGFLKKEQLENTMIGVIDKINRATSLKKIKTCGNRRKKSQEKPIIKRNPNSRKRVVLVGNKNMRP